MDPHLLIMRKSPTEKGREEVCVCLYMCPCVSVVHMKWRIPGSQGRVKGKGPHPVYLSVFSRPGLPHLSGWSWFGLSSSHGWFVSVFPQRCWFPEITPSACFCCSPVFAWCLFFLWIRINLSFSFSSPCGVYRRLKAPGHAGLFQMHLSVRPASITHPVLLSLSPPLQLMSCKHFPSSEKYLPASLKNTQHFGTSMSLSFLHDITLVRSSALRLESELFKWGK